MGEKKSINQKASISGYLILNDIAAGIKRSCYKKYNSFLVKIIFTYSFTSLNVSLPLPCNISTKYKPGLKVLPKW
jgi:hypothetical protein